MPILEVREITSGYGEVQVLWGASVALEEGKMTCLVGANGVGKTTLLRTVMGLVLVPEGRQLFTDMSVRENLEMGASNHRARQHLKRNLERVFDMFPRLKERINQKAGTLSGGEQQMVSVARGLMAEPKVLMIDELSLGLSPVLTVQLFQNLKQLKQTGLTILLVEQNVQMALAVSDYGYVLAQGRTELQGHARQLASNDHVRTAYLGL